MAEIVVNGGLIIKPGVLPYHVSARRDLNDILHELQSIERAFVNIGSDDRKEIKTLLGRIRDLNANYSDLLQSCSEGLRQELASQSNQHQAYFKPLLSFLSRASNLHTLLPFVTYIFGFPEVPFYLSFGEHSDFITLRMGEAIATCKAYISLSSQTTADVEASVDLGALVTRAFTIAREKSVRRTIEKRLRLDAFSEEDDIQRDTRLRSLFQQLKQKAQRTSTVTSQHHAAVYSYPDLLFFYLVNTFDNHFKAAEGKYGEGKLRSHSKVTVHIHPYGEYHVAVTSKDNGIGIPQTEMSALFDPDKEQPKGYRGYERGNGRTLPIYPHICDLLRSALIVRSKGRKKGAEFTLLLPKDVQSPRDINYTLH